MLPLEVKSILQICSSQDGEFMSALVQCDDSSYQVLVYHISTLKLQQQQTLQETKFPPDDMYFAQQSKILLLIYKQNAKSYIFSWQRGMMEDVLQVMDEPKIIKVCHYTQSTITTVNQSDQIRFWRLFDTDLRPFAPTRMKQLVNDSLKFVSVLFLGGGLQCCVLQNGELLIFQPPKFLGAIKLQLSTDDDVKYDFDMKQQTKLRGDIHLAIARGEHIVLVTKSNQLLYIELNIDIQAYLQKYKVQSIGQVDQQSKKDYFNNEFSDDLDSIDSLLELLPKIKLSIFKVPVSEYPCKILCSTQLNYKSQINNIQLGLEFCLLETQDQLFIWNYTGQKVLFNGTTLISEQEYDTFQQTQQSNIKNRIEPLQIPKHIQSKILDEQQDIIISTLINQQFQELSIDVSTVRSVLNYVNLYKQLDESKQFIDFNDLDDFFWEGQNITKENDDDSALQLDILSLKQNALNQLTPPITFNMLILGLSFKNLSPRPLQHICYGPRLSLKNHYCVPHSFRIGLPITIQDICFSSVKQQTALVASQSTIYGLQLPSLNIFAVYDIKNIRYIELSPGEKFFYALVFDQILIFSIFESSFKIIYQISNKNVSFFRISHSGGYIAVVIEYSNKFLVQIVSLQSNKMIFEIASHSSRLLNVCFGFGDYSVFSNSEDGVVYGHLITGERFFEQSLRGVPMFLSTALLQSQIKDNEEEVETEVGQKVLKQEQYILQEKFVFCGLDKFSNYYELNGSGQTHQVKLCDDLISSFCLVPCLLTKWNAKLIRIFGQLNTEDEISAIEKESLTATTSLFNRALGDFFDRQALNKSLKNTNEPLILSSKHHYDEKKIYFDSDYRMHTDKHGEQLGELNYRFIIVGTENGQIICFNWPVRDNKEIFRIQLHKEPIIQLKIINQSCLISISKNQVITSNLRYYLPQENIFGLNIRNQDLAKMKRAIGKQSTNIKIPITRSYNSLTQSFLSRSTESVLLFDNQIVNLIYSMKDMWTFSDFRINLFKENVRDKINQIQKGITFINQQKLNEVTNIRKQKNGVQSEIETIMKQETNKHNAISQDIMASFQDSMQTYRINNDRIQKEIIRYKQEHKQHLKEAEVQRTKILQQTKQSVQIKEIEKQNQLDHLDETIDAQEKQLTEELKQLAEERQILQKQLISSKNTTVDREQANISMLKTWASVQDRKIIQVQYLIQDSQKQINAADQQLAQISNDLNNVQSQFNLQVKILKDKDNEIKFRENTIFRLKEEISELGKIQAVLNQMVTDIQHEIGPRDNLITDMKVRSEDLGKKLEQTTKTWEQIQQQIQQGDQLAIQNSDQLKVLQSREQSNQRYLNHLKSQFSNIMIDQQQRMWFPKIINLWQNNINQLKQVEHSGTKQLNNLVDGQVTSEIEDQRQVLDQKLNLLYEGLDEENKKFVNVQQFSLDENSALLEESHRLKTENIDLIEKLSKVNSMIQALKVQEVTKALQKQTKSVQRTEKVVSSLNKRFGLSEPRSLSVLSQSLKAEKEKVEQLKTQILKVPQPLRKVQDFD